MTPAPPATLLIACGALAREIVSLTRAHHWRHLTIACLPALTGAWQIDDAYVDPRKGR